MTASRIALAMVLAAPAVASAAPPGALERRVQALEAQQQIGRILIEYGLFLDGRDYARYSRLFARDGEWVGGFGRFRGPAAIQAMLEKQLGKAPPGFVNKTSYHLMSGPIVTVTGDTATATSRYLFVTATPEGRPAPAIAGRYVDDFVREGGAWKIRRRVTHGVIPWRDGDDPNPPPPPAARRRAHEPAGQIASAARIRGSAGVPLRTSPSRPRRSGDR